MEKRKGNNCLLCRIIFDYEGANVKYEDDYVLGIESENGMEDEKFIRVWFIPKRHLGFEEVDFGGEIEIVLLEAIDNFRYKLNIKEYAISFKKDQQRDGHVYAVFEYLFDGEILKREDRVII